MYFVQKEYSDVYEIKKSKFISYILPFEFFEEKMSVLKNEHPKASHFVYAYRYLNHDQIVEAASDDGEPKSSSGPPILSILRGGNYINTAIIVVRYFGGTKLGVGGLVKAYLNSAKIVLLAASKLEYIALVDLEFKIPYEKLSILSYIQNKYNIDIEKSFIDEFVELKLKVPTHLVEEIKSLFTH